MKFLKILLLISFVICTYNSNAQFTTQKKIVSRLNTFGSKTIDLKSNGILMVSNFDRDSLPINNQTNYGTKYGTYIIRLDNNFDTIWTKIIYNHSFADCILNKSDKIILVGKNYQLAGSQVLCGMSLIKLDLNGTILKSVQNKNVCIADINDPNSNGNFSTYSVAYINEYKDNAYIVFNGSSYKFDDNFNLIDKKKYSFANPGDIIPSFNFNSGNQLLMLNDSTLATSFRYIGPGTNTGVSFNNAILTMDTSLFLKKYLLLDNIFTFINSITSLNNKLFISGRTIDPAYNNFFGFDLNFLTHIDFNNIILKKPAIRFRSNYARKYTSGYRKTNFVRVYKNKIYLMDDEGYLNNINDSLGLNNRKHFYAFDTSLNLMWNKRIHLFNSINTFPLDEINSYYGIRSLEKTNDFLFKGSNVILTNYDSQEQYYSSTYYNRSNFGFNLSKIDTSGNNALCNATNFSYYKDNDSIGFVNLPTPTTSNFNFIFEDINVVIENFPTQKITQKCLPLLPPKSKFKIEGLANSDSTCLNNAFEIREYSYNEPKTWHWIFPPQVNTSGLDSFYLPFVSTIKFTQAGTYPIKLVTTNDAGSDTCTQYVTILGEAQQPNLGNDFSICIGDTVKIIYQNAPNTSHNFYGPGIFTQSDTLKIIASGQYFIEVNSLCNTVYDTINVSISTKPIAGFTTSNTCGSLQATITSTASALPSTAIQEYYYGNTLLGTGASITTSFPSYGSYEIKHVVKNGSCISDTVSNTLNIESLQLFTTPRIDTIASINQLVKLNVSGALNYLWTSFPPSSGSILQNANTASAIFTASTSGIYPIKVEGTTALGCKGIANINVKVFADNAYVWIPNTFTPNADGLNDKIKITCSGLQSLTYFTIYNRYGETVYTQTGCNANGWDGIYKGVMQPQGIYVYSWAGINFKEENVNGKGTIMLSQ